MLIGSCWSAWRHGKEATCWSLMLPLEWGDRPFWSNRWSTWIFTGCNHSLGWLCLQKNSTILNKRKHPVSGGSLQMHNPFQTTTFEATNILSIIFIDLPNFLGAQHSLRDLFCPLLATFQSFAAAASPTPPHPIPSIPAVLSWEQNYTKPQLPGDRANHF